MDSAFTSGNVKFTKTTLEIPIWGGGWLARFWVPDPK